ncbi:MAG TPA: hypothetical protein VGV85_16215 [Longimicrobiaceae bacterium]|nr:hypothetical protein [Longimicrobiaceae bacterium]
MISGRLPITMVTAMVSPSARPSPRMVAPMIPGVAYGSTTCQVISQRVAPSASAPSRCTRGTAASTSRDTAEMKGITMIARITPADRMLTPYAGPRKSGTVSPRVLASGSWMAERSQGTSTKIPHSP